MWRLLSAVRVQERSRFVFLFALGALVSLAQVVGLAGAEALFLARLGARELPVTFVAASAATVLASLLYALRVGRARNDRVFVELLVVAGLAIGAAGAAASGTRVWPLPTLLCLYFVTQAVLVNHFWTFTGDFFDTLASKRVVPLFTVGMSAGGAVGGGVAMAVNAAAPPWALVVAWALLLVASGALLQIFRERLQRWRAVAVDEEDETSVEGIRAAIRYVQRSALGRWLVVSALTMVLALFVAQYLYSDVIASAFPDAGELAAFLGAYLAVTNLIEIAVELWITPALIRRVGVPGANLAHPVLSFASLLALGWDYRLPAAIGARMNREMLDNALAQPVRNLVYNALPMRFRSRVRAFLEGIVVYSGMSLAGVVLLAVKGLGPEELCWIGAALAGLYGLANWRVRREYLDAIVTEIRAGRIDLSELGAELGPRQLAALVEPWSRVLEQEREPSAAILDLAPLLAEQGLTAPILEALSHPSATVRAACLRALARAERGVDAGVWLAGLDDPAVEVRRAALRFLPSEAEESAGERLRALARDPDPDVRALAAAHLGAEGDRVLAAMLDSGDSDAVVAALTRLPARHVGRAAEHMADPDPRVRAAALEALALADGDLPIDLPKLAESLAAADARVRRAAVAALEARREPAAAAALARALVDPFREVRSAAVDALAQRGPEGFEAALPALEATREASVGAALRVLAASADPRARDRLRAEYAARTREAWEALLCARELPESRATTAAFLRLACLEALARAVRLAFRTLKRLEDPAIVRSIDSTLRFEGGRVRGDALEVLSHLGDRETARWFVLLLEPGPLEDKLAALAGFATPPRDRDEALERMRRSSSPWLRMAAGGEEAPDADVPAPGPAREGWMERLLTLRRVSLFSHLSLERLQAVERITEQAEYVKGEVIVREGARGEDLYLLVEGEVEVVRGAGTPAEERLNRMGPGSHFGEIAVLDGSPRSATVVAATDVRVLVLAGRRLRELIHELPDIAFEIFRVLTERIRSAEGRLAEAGHTSGTGGSS